MQKNRIEIEEVMFFNLKKEMEESENPQIKSIEGILKSFTLNLASSTIAEEQLKKIFIYALAGIEIINDVSNFKIVKQSLLLLKKNWLLFSEWIITRENQILEKLLLLVGHKNRQVKELASETLEAFAESISARESTSHQREVLNYLLGRVKHRMERGEDPVEIMLCIRLYGTLSRSVKLCFGEQELQKHFFMLMETSEAKIIRRLSMETQADLDDEEVKPENFKLLLYNQKQLNSHIISFARIVKEMDYIKERDGKHILKLFLMGVKIHTKIFEGYKKYLYKALVETIISLYKHKKIFKFWLKRLIRETLSITISVPVNLARHHNGELYAIKKSSELYIALLRSDDWEKAAASEARQLFVQELVLAVLAIFETSQLEYREIYEEGKRLYLPKSHEDQHISYRAALLFEELIEKGFLEETLLQNFRPFINRISSLVLAYPRVTSSQKMLRSLFLIAGNQESELLHSNTHNSAIMAELIKKLYSSVKELQGDVLYENIRTLLSVPTFLINKNSFIKEIIKRVLVLALELATQDNFYLVIDILETMELLLLKGRVEFEAERTQFLKMALPHFSSLLSIEKENNKNSGKPRSVRDLSLTSPHILAQVIEFLGSLGSESQYLTSKLKKDIRLQNYEGETLQLHLPVYQRVLALNLNRLIERVSTLAARGVEDAACELLHAATIFLIGKCAEGNQHSADFVESMDNALPQILKLGVSESKFARLFRELGLQISRWLGHNKDPENSLVSSFLTRLLEQSSLGDKPELRALCSDIILEFLRSTTSLHKTLPAQLPNYQLLLRKVEALSLHPDLYCRLAGLISLKQLIVTASQQSQLMRRIFFDAVYYYLLLVRTHDRQQSPAVLEDYKYLCEDLFTKIEYIAQEKAEWFVRLEVEGGRFRSMDELFLSLKGNLFCPEPNLRFYSTKLWQSLKIFCTRGISQNVLSSSLDFLKEGIEWPHGEEKIALERFIAYTMGFNALLESKTLEKVHLLDSKIFEFYKEKIGVFVGVEFGDEEDLANRAQDALLQYLRLANLLKSKDLGLEQEQAHLLDFLDKEKILKGVLDNLFSDSDLEQRGLNLCKKCMQLFNVDPKNYLEQFIINHRLDFLSRDAQLFEFSYKIDLNCLERFLNLSRKLLGYEELAGLLQTRHKVKSFISFIKSSTKKPHNATIERSRIFLNFLAKLDLIPIDILPRFVDPNTREYEFFGLEIQKYILNNKNKISLINHLLKETLSNSAIFPTVIGLLSQLEPTKDNYEPMITVVPEIYPIEELQSCKAALKFVLYIISLVFKTCENFLEDYTVGVVNLALRHDNMEELGFSALELLSEYFRIRSEIGISWVFSKLKDPLVNFGSSICPTVVDLKQLKGPSSGEKLRLTRYITICLDLMSRSCSLLLIELIFPILRSKNAFSQELNLTIQNIAEKIKEKSRFITEASVCYKILEDKEISKDLIRNIRFEVINKCLLPFLESSCEENLIEFFVEYYPKMKQQLRTELSSNRKEILSEISFKKSIFLILEILYRKISSDGIKDAVHQNLIGKNTQGNEITKQLILLCHNAKKEKIILHNQILEEMKLSGPAADFKTAKDCLYGYYNSAYCCLGSVLITTQSKISVFQSFLFKEKIEKKEFIFENLVDPEFDFGFEITNKYRMVHLHEYYKIRNDKNSIPGGMTIENGEKIKKEEISSLARKIADDSLFTQTLNRGRIQPLDIIEMSKTASAEGREKLLELFKDSESKNAFINENFGLDESSAPAGAKDEIELDPLNNLGAIKTMVRALDQIINKLDPQKIDKVETEIPPYIEIFYRKLKEPNLALQIRIFIIKILINRPNFFRPYRSFFNSFLLEYLSLNQNGGKGFHYFLRDVCMTLIYWNENDSAFTVVVERQLLKQLAFRAVAALGSKLADKARHVFIINIEVFQKIVSLLKENLNIDEELVLRMLTCGAGKENDNNQSKEGSITEDGNSMMEEGDVVVEGFIGGITARNPKLSNSYYKRYFFIKKIEKLKMIILKMIGCYGDFLDFV